MPLRSFASRAKRRAKAVVDNLKKDNTSVHDTVKAKGSATAASEAAAPAAAPKAAASKATPKAAPKAAKAPPKAAKAAPKAAKAASKTGKKASAKAAAKTDAPAEKKAAPAMGFAALAAKAAAGDLGDALHADSSGTDLEAYKARAKLLGRDVEGLAGEGLNTAEDGTAFWGPIDCESSRAKAEGLVLNVDQELCISCGTCEENTDLVFYLPNEEDAKAEVLAQGGPMDLIQDAIDACPVMCIAWLGEGELPERVSPTPDELAKQIGG